MTDKAGGGDIELTAFNEQPSVTINKEENQNQESIKDLKKIFKCTLFVKDLKKMKEAERARRSQLIYGTKDMKTKIFERQQLEKNEQAQAADSEAKIEDDDQKKKKEKKCKEYFLLNPKDRFLSTFESAMLIVIAYSCFSSAYFTAFEMDSCDMVIISIEHVVFICFTLEIIFKFMRLSDDENIIVSEQDHSTIAKRYIKSGEFFFDFLATFPFYMFSICPEDGEEGGNFGIWFKLMRLVRIPRIVALLNLARFNRFVETVFSGSTRGKRVVFQLIMKNVYKVFRLILLTVIITYFLGCAFYFVSSIQFKYLDFQGNTFIKEFELDEASDKSDFYKFITSCYFSITTLSTVGYGDLYPISNAEKVLGIIIMLAGVGFFSYIMGSFIEIISTFNQNLGVEDQTFELHNWMTLLTRFRDRKPLPNYLYRQINQHFKYYWANNRLSQVQKDSEFINALPRSIKRGIVVHYLFDDIFYNFRYFFRPQQYKDSKFLYDVAFGIKPRHFSEKEDENVIYDEEEEVLEMYFIITGTVGIGYHLYQQPLEESSFKITHNLGSNSFFGDYYLCNNTKAEFVHIAKTEVEAFALSKKFLMRKVFPKYPNIYREIKDESKYRYNSSIKDEIMKHKYAHIEVVNKRSTYNNIQLKAKLITDISSQQLLVRNSQSEVGAQNLRQQFQERIVGIEQEMKKIDSSLSDFLSTVTTDFNGLVGKIDQMKDNMSQLKTESRKSRSELEAIKARQNAGSEAFNSLELQDKSGN